MAQPIEFRYFLRKPNGTDYDYYFINPSGNIDYLTSSTPTKPLLFAPDGWMDKMLNWERGFKYYATLRTFTVPLKFTKDGAKLVRHFHYTEGIESNVELYIEKFDTETMTIPNVLDWVYKPFYYGELEFNSFLDDREFVTCSIMEGGFLANLTTKESTDYEIKVRENVDRIWVKMHPFPFQFKCKWIGANALGADIDVYPNFSYFSQEGKNFNLNLGDQVKNSTIIALDSTMIQNISNSPQSMEIAFDFYYNVYIGSLPSGSSASNQPYYFRILYKAIPSSGPDYLLSVAYLSTFGLNQFQSHTYQDSIVTPITLNAGDKFYIGIDMYSSTHPNQHLTHHEYDLTEISAEVRLSLSNYTKETYIPALRPKTVYDTLIDKINNGNAINKVSNLLENIHFDKVITSFDAIRNLPKSILKTNFNSFHKSMNGIYNTSFMYKTASNEAIYEEKVNAYQNIQVVDFGEVSKMKITPFNNEMFANFSVGQSEYTYDEVNGKDEFNTESKYLNPVNSIKNDKDLKRDYRTDAYGIFTTILNLEGKEIIDADSDNDVAMLHIEQSVGGTIPNGFDGVGEDYYNLYRKTIDLSAGPNYWNVENIFSPETMINFFFSSLRCVLRHGNWLHGLLFGLDSEKITFQTSSKSNNTATKLKTSEGSPVVVLDEGADIDINSLDNPIIKPFIFEFEALSKISFIDIMNTNPYGYAKVRWLENDYYGFIIKASQEPATNKPQTIKLLSHPTLNDFSKLIY